MELLSKKEIEELTENYPLYSQDEKKGDTKVLYHFFIGSADWYVFEGSKEGIAPDGKDNITLFGIANIIEPEFGYFTLYELESTKVPQKIIMGGAEFTIDIEIERDKYFKQTTLEKLETNEVITEFLINMGYKK